MLWGLPKMLNVLVCQLVISHCNQGFHMAFDRGRICLSHDLHCLSISIEIRIFWANGPFKYFLPRTLFGKNRPDYHGLGKNSESRSDLLISFGFQSASSPSLGMRAANKVIKWEGECPQCQPGCLSNKRLLLSFVLLYVDFVLGLENG